MKKTMLLFCTLLLFSGRVFAQDITQGTWFNEEKDAKIQIFKQGDKFFGKIVWLKEPNENGKPKVDKNNPDDKLKTRPRLGMIFLKNYKFNGKDLWEDGEVYDPKNGKTYSGKITMVSPKQLDLRGYIGISLLGRTSHWTKAD